MLIPRDEVIRQNARLNEVRDEIIAELMQIRGVIAVSDGVKRVAGSLVPEICIKVIVEKKKDIKDIPESERVPPEIKGFKTDVEERADVELHEDENTYRPLVAGTCIGTSSSPGVGTMGCFATVNAGAHAGKVVLLSNFHVLCPTDGTVPGNRRVGQPRHNGCCSCCACDEIGQVIDGEVLNANLDCAIARIFTGGADPKDIRWQESAIIGVGLVAGAGPIVTPGTRYSVMPGETVFKRGRTTEFTEGTVSLRGHVTTPMVYNEVPRITRVKTDQMQITPTAPFIDFSMKGDSGSVIVNAKNEVVGLLFGGDPVSHFTVANHIDYVTTRLNITINSALTETGLPVASIPVCDDHAIGTVTDDWMEKAKESLTRYEAGKKIADLLYKHHREVTWLVRSNREVRTAWMRYSGPGFLNHLARSIRDNHPIPLEVRGNTLESLLLKMTAVLMRHGSESLIEDLEQSYMLLMEITSSGNRFTEWLEKLKTIGNRHVHKHPAAVI
jgi:hypothetical protein